MTAPRRSWSFRLRTLFVVVTVLACWLGWQLHIVRKRQAAATELEWMLFDTWKEYTPNAPILVGRRIPWWRALMGDEVYVRFDIVKPNEELARRIESLFPEAMIVEGGEIRRP